MLYKAPLKFLTTIIVDILQDILREYLKRKLTQRDATNFYFISFNVSKILKIPIGASHLIIQLNNFPLYISKRFDQDIDKSLVKGLGQSNPNLSKYIRDGLCTLSFGIALSDQLLTQSVFWDKDRHIEYVNQIIEIPKYDYVNINKYAYIYLNESMDVTVSYLK